MPAVWYCPLEGVIAGDLLSSVFMTALQLCLEGKNNFSQEQIEKSYSQAYHIDLTRTDYMHWHLFKALLNGLPSNTYMKEIMAMRSYKKETKTYEQQQRYLKNIWALGNSQSNLVDQDTMDEINALFYNS